MRNKSQLLPTRLAGEIQPGSRFRVAVRFLPVEILPLFQTCARMISIARGRCNQAMRIRSEPNRIALQNESVMLPARNRSDDQEWFCSICNLIWQRGIGRFVG